MASNTRYGPNAGPRLLCADWLIRHLPQILTLSLLISFVFGNHHVRSISQKIPWRLSTPQKARQRKRLRMVDNVITTVDSALAKAGQTSKAVERWKAEMPKEEEMVARDKYTVFDRKAKRYRKGIHKVPKWTRVSQRINPPGF